MKRLLDLCLTCVGDHLDRLCRPGTFLAPRHKELLLESLCNHDKLTPSYLLSVTYNLFSPALKTIDFSRSSQVTDDLLQLLHSSKCQLLNLTIHGCPKVTDKGILAVTKGQVALRCLELRKLPKLTGAGLSNICSVDLERLCMYGCNRITSSGLSAISKTFCALSSLDLSFCSQLESSPDALLELPTSLMEFSLGGIQLKDEDLFIRILTRLPLLSEIRLYGVPAVSDYSIAQILNVIGAQLRLIDLGGPTTSVPLTDAGLGAISEHCGQLSSLSLSLLRSITGHSLLPMFRNADKARCLTSLIIRCTKFEAEVLLAVALNCSSLTRLDMAGMAHVDDDIVRAFAEHCRQLTYVGLKGCHQVTDEAVILMARNLPLTVLVLSGLNLLTDSCVYALANSCPQLEQLFVSGCSRVSRETVLWLTRQCLPRVYYEHNVPNPQGRGADS
ncbi:hypothetical protein CAPTEDRAFT_224967 [Capitella teleta]|uniref:F-box/LRR-repeat protein 15-like leucin rich repeat domain-containing protein n=1 Tax=Capitella teleta TaxID=283909 RepID=R7USW2_CAPTE|nr:hypothetical protein CAPTEDRAFT_224967 [Capitella teleta]|eukprot:ELU07002.1 hypothetical protein CAPTEDRAFT_224967 [Capitella teleta]